MDGDACLTVHPHAKVRDAHHAAMWAHTLTQSVSLSKHLPDHTAVAQGATADVSIGRHTACNIQMTYENLTFIHGTTSEIILSTQ